MGSLDKKTGVLGKRLAAHLLRRATFRPTQENIDIYANLTVDQAVSRLFEIQPLFLEKPIDPQTGQEWVTNGATSANSANFKLIDYIRGWWLNEAILDNSIGHKMQFFLHSIWNTHFGAKPSEFFFDHLQLLRHFTLGNYKVLAEKMTKDNLMLLYLNNNENTKNNINENYAREFLELFTIGKGPQVSIGNYTNYTEDDIVSAAKVFTGFKVDYDRQHIDPETGIPSGFSDTNLHDFTNKSFSQVFDFKVIYSTILTLHNGVVISKTKTHLEEFREFIEMIFSKPAASQHIVKKLYRFFVSRHITPEIELNIITPLAADLLSNNYEIRTILEKLLKSNHFYNNDDFRRNHKIIGGLIKSPLELIANIITQLKINIPSPLTDSFNHYHEFYYRSIITLLMDSSGLVLFGPSSVAGYPAYYQIPTYHRNWFNSSSLEARYKLPEAFLKGKRLLTSGTLGGVKLDILDFVKNNISNAQNANALVDQLIELLLPEPLDAARRSYFLDDILMNHLPYFDWKEDWNAFIGDQNNLMKQSTVRSPLENLITALLYSPEFQLG